MPKVFANSRLKVVFLDAILWCDGAGRIRYVYTLVPGMHLAFTWYSCTRGSTAL